MNHIIMIFLIAASRNLVLLNLLQPFDAAPEFFQAYVKNLFKSTSHYRYWLQQSSTFYIA